MKCSLCGREAVYFKAHSGQAFCPRCFKRVIERGVRRNICRYKMLEPDDRIAVAVSGGKDSLSLLRMLHKIEQKFPKSELIAISVDEGIGRKREEDLRRVEGVCRELGVELIKGSFKDLYGVSLPEIAERVDLGPCTVCGILRRKALNVLSREAGADKLVTAHNLDDWAQTVIINLMRGTVERLLALDPRPARIHPKLVPRVAPLFNIREEEVALYAYLSGIGVSGENCPYVRSSMRYRVRLFLNRMEREHSGIKYAILGAYWRLKEAWKVTPKVRECRICGEPTSAEVCQACLILEKARG